MAVKTKQKLNVTDESRSVPMTIILLAWPVFVEQIFNTLVSFADTAMVGSLGKEATASISISNSPIFLLNGVIMSLGVGITTMVAHAVGAGDQKKVQSLMRHAFLAILYVGLPISIIVALCARLIPMWMGAGPDILDTATRYNLITSVGRVFVLASMVLNSAFRGYGDTKTPMKLNIIMNVVNICGNYLLINPTHDVNIMGMVLTIPGAGWGVEGAAVATALGMTVAGLMAFRVAFKKTNPYRIVVSKHFFRPDKGLTRQVFNISIPAMLERIFMSSSGILVASSIAMLGTASIAADSLYLSAESLSYMPAFAFQMAITTLVGQSLGAKKPYLAEKFLRWTLIMGTVVMAATSVFLYTCAEMLIGLFTPDQEVIKIGADCLRIMSYIQIPQMASWVFAGFLRGAGDTKFNFYISAATNWGIRTLFSVIMIRLMGLDLVATCWTVVVENVVRLVLLYLRYRTGKWETLMEVQKRKAGIVDPEPEKEPEPAEA